MKTFKPMLAATIDDVSELRYPLLASVKLDGVRAMVRDGVLVSRNLKPIPNKHVQKMFGRKALEGFDGELIVGDPTDPAAFRNTSSAVMSHDGEPDVVFHVFDVCNVEGVKYIFRLHHLQMATRDLTNVQLVGQVRVVRPEDVDLYETTALNAGYEGVMLRSEDASYKWGRSTLKEQGLMKLKRFEDAEAKITGFAEQMHNSNEAKTSALGTKERSSKKSGMVGKDTLGALKVEGVNGTYKGVEFNIGTGFDDAQRRKIWLNRRQWIGKIVKYKYFPTGSKDAPRFPVFIGLRDKVDM